MNRLENSHTAAIRLVLIAQRRLDCDALAALFQAHANFRMLCTTTSLKVASEIVRHRRPDLLIMDGELISQRSEERFDAVIAQFDPVPVMVLDDDINIGRLAAMLNSPRTGYFTRHIPFEELARGICRLVSGERAFAPVVLDRLQQTSNGWQLRKDERETPLSSLTPREVEVLRRVALGHSIKHCAEVLELAPSTVDNHKARLMKKLGVHKSLDLTRLAIREGLVSI